MKITKTLGILPILLMQIFENGVIEAVAKYSLKERASAAIQERFSF